MVEKITQLTNQDAGTENDGQTNEEASCRRKERDREGDRESRDEGEGNERNKRDDAERREDNGEKKSQEIQPGSELYVLQLICNTIVENNHLSQPIASSPMQGSENESPEPQNDEGTQFFCRILVICVTPKLDPLSQGKFIILDLLGNAHLYAMTGGECIPAFDVGSHL